MKNIIHKPWGKEEIIEINENYMVKKLTMFKGHRCSLQYHEKKCETIFVLSGKLKIYFGNFVENLKFKIYGPNESITIKPGLIHRMEGIEESIYIESSTPELEDVIRVSDDYDRVNS